MHRLSRLFLLILILIQLDAKAQFESKFTTEQLSSAPVKLIPYPQQVKWLGDELSSKTFTLQSEAFGDLSVQYLNDLAGELDFKVDDSGTNISVNENSKLVEEGYNLHINKKGITIESSSESGLFYAFQTLRQLMQTKDGLIALPFCKINDQPEHGFRGYMIDVGRNYQSMEMLKKQLDIMAQYKLNVFHWHLTDRPAWRIESKMYPELTYSRNHRQTRDPGIFYTYDEIRELIAYAKELHIKVIPEIDMPGHSDSFVTSMGVKMESPEGMIILENVLKEFFAEIPREDCPIIHIGSDEVRIPNPEEFIAKMVQICEDHDREVIIWNPGLVANDNVIRQTWQGKHVEKGNYREIDSWENYINGAVPMVQVQRLFFRPIGFGSENNVIGGEVCFWPDVNISQEDEAYEQNPVYTSLLTYSWATWTADVQKNVQEYNTMVPSKGTEAYNYFAAFEDYLLDHKERYFANEPFQYWRQTDKHWQLIGSFDYSDHGRLIKAVKEGQQEIEGKKWRSAVGNSFMLRERWEAGGYYSEADSGSVVYGRTFIYSDQDRSVPTMVGFETALRANKIYTGVPEQGIWDPSGGQFWVNGEEVAPPNWDNAGWKPSKQSGWGGKADQEIPWEPQDFYWTRKPTSIELKQGWNEVIFSVPCSSDYQNWMFTFIPADMTGIRFAEAAEN